MKKILSIDGGGIRGIIPGMLLYALEKKLKRISNDPDAAIVDYFDFFAGTSTGGILTCLLLCPDDQDPSRPKYSAKQALDLYVDHGTRIFTAGFFRKMMAEFGLLSERYESQTFESILQEYFGDAKLSQLIKPCLITAYNIELRKTHFFRQQTAVNRGDVRDFYLRDVCRATSAAPTYFSVAEIYSLAGTRFPLLDGGVFAPNPSMSALVDVTRAFNQTMINDISILSLGTGRSRTPYDYENFKKRRAITVGPAIIDIMMTGAAESSDFFLEQLYRSYGKSEQYIRIEPKNLHSIQGELDAASRSNIQKLIALADRMISENEELLNNLAHTLLIEKDKPQPKPSWSFLRSKSNSK